MMMDPRVKPGGDASGVGLRDESLPLMPLSGEGLSRLRVEGRIGGQT
jgi:hypothetical protein